MKTGHWTALVAVVALGALCAGGRRAGDFEVIPDGAAPVEYAGTCDASASVFLGGGYFVVANDEDSVLRIYREGQPRPVRSLDVTRFLEPTRRYPENDIEAVAARGDRAYWITSHARTPKGKPRRNRDRFFATQVLRREGRVAVAVTGRPYSDLQRDLLAEPRLQRYAAELAPKGRRGLNIEGLAAAPDGSLLIGLRAPVPGGKALLIPLEDPEAVVRGEERARLGEPIELGLGGLGVRAIEYVPALGAYLIVGGPADEEIGGSRLFVWSGAKEERPVVVAAVDFEDLNPEAIAVDAEGGRVQILSDDGGRLVDGRTCKSLGRAASKSFRAVDLELW